MNKINLLLCGLSIIFSIASMIITYHNYQNLYNPFKVGDCVFRWHDSSSNEIKIIKINDDLIISKTCDGDLCTWTSHHLEDFRLMYYKVKCLEEVE